MKQVLMDKTLDLIKTTDDTELLREWAIIGFNIVSGLESIQGIAGDWEDVLTEDDEVSSFATDFIREQVWAARKLYLTKDM